MDILEEWTIQENEPMSTKPRRQFTPEPTAEAVRIVTQSGKPISPIAKEMGLTERALRNWVKPAQIDPAAAPNGALTTQERQELAQLRRAVHRWQLERECLKKAAACFAAPNSPMSESPQSRQTFP
jgi:transposase